MLLGVVVLGLFGISFQASNYKIRFNWLEEYFTKSIIFFNKAKKFGQRHCADVCFYSLLKA